MKEIYLAGGCFWGTDMYLSQLMGVIETEVGYANGMTDNPTYEQVCEHGTGHAETVKAVYDERIISLSFLLDMYYETINPVSVNKQGGDLGTQYRTGIYYTQPSDREIILTSISKLQSNYKEKIAIEVLPLVNYYKAEEYHQKYLIKNPGGYCHISKAKFAQAREAIDLETANGNNEYKAGDEEDVWESLTDLQYHVAMENGTEPPFQNEYFDNFKAGIYVDITTGEPLFMSSSKFESGCGWPSFAEPIHKDLITEIEDRSFGMKRTEVRSKKSNIHLGHVFTDGKKELGGLRYCINSASLRFIPVEKMEEKGYGSYIPYLEMKR